MKESSKKEVIRIMVTLDKEQYEILQKVKGMGVKDAEKVRNIVLAWLAEKSFIKKHSERL
jgi:hypothetical protein